MASTTSRDSRPCGSRPSDSARPLCARPRRAGRRADGGPPTEADRPPKRVPWPIAAAGQARERLEFNLRLEFVVGCSVPALPQGADESDADCRIRLGWGSDFPQMWGWFSPKFVCRRVLPSFWPVLCHAPPLFCLPLYRACISCISQVLKTCVDLRHDTRIRCTIQIVSIDTSRYIADT